MSDVEVAYAGKRAGYFRSRRPEMLAFVPLGARDIVEFGCGAGDFAAQIKQRQNARIVGVEIVSAAAKSASEKLDLVFERDVERGLSFLKGQLFDCAVFIDVLEHLRSPWDVLADLKEYLKPDGVIVASIPNVRYLEVLKMLVLKSRFQYEDEGVMDRTHLRFFARDDIIDLFEQSQYSIERVVGIQGGFPWKFGLLNMLLLNALNDTQYKQFAVVARPK